MKSTDRSAEPSCTESSMASTDLRADLERHTPAVWHDDHWDFCDPDHPDASCRECEVFWPCDAARALALLDEAEAQVAACVTLFPATVAAGLTDDLLSALTDAELRALAEASKRHAPGSSTAWVRGASPDRVLALLDEVARLEAVVKLATHMGLCSQTHHEYLMLVARDALLWDGAE